MRQPKIYMITHSSIVGYSSIKTNVYHRILIKWNYGPIYARFHDRLPENIGGLRPGKSTYVRSASNGGGVEVLGHSSELTFSSVISSHFRLFIYKNNTEIWIIIDWNTRLWMLFLRYVFAAKWSPHKATKERPGNRRRRERVAAIKEVESDKNAARLPRLPTTLSFSVRQRCASQLMSSGFLDHKHVCFKPLVSLNYN